MSVCESEGKRIKLRMGRSPCCDKDNVKRGPWSPEEDAALKSYIHAHGTGSNWIHLPKKSGLRRCGKSCRLRWLNYLRPDIKHGGFTEEEDYLICSLYNQMGSRWSIIASQMRGRTDNDVRNYWNTKLKKKLFGGKINPASITTKDPSHVLPFAPKSEPKDSAFSTFETQNPATLQMITDVNSGLNAYNPDQFLSPELNGFSELGANVKKNYSTAAVSLSQDCSSTVSDSSSMPANGGALDDSGIFMDFESFGLPYEMANFDNGMLFGEKASYSDPAICSTNFADSFPPDMKPQDRN